MQTHHDKLNRWRANRVNIEEQVPEQQGIGHKLKGFFPWFKKGAWSIVDQGLFAGANFVLNILLARWLFPKEYGAFTVAFSLFLLLGMFHTALLTEPMLVFGSSLFKRKWTQYFGVLLRGHVGFAVLGMVVLGVGGFGLQYFETSDLGRDLIVLAAAQPFILFLWLVRRACYVTLNPRLASAGGVLYALLMLGGAYGLYRNAWLSVSTVLILMSLSSLASGLWIMMRLGLGSLVPMQRCVVTQASQKHWSYGRWALSTGVLTWATSQLVALILPLWAGLESTAAFKALMNLTMPAIHAYVAFSVLLVPVLVRAQEKGDFKRFMYMAIGLTAVAMGLYGLILGFGGKPMLQWLYNDQYTEYAWMLWPIGILPLLAGIMAVLNAVLRAIERPDYVFWVYVGTSITVVTVGVGLIYSFGLLGAVMCQIVVMIVGVFILVYLLFSGRVSLPSGPSTETPTSHPSEHTLV